MIAAQSAILDHGERLARAALAGLPNGTWSATDWLDDDGITDDPILDEGDDNDRRRHDGRRFRRECRRRGRAGQYALWGDRKPWQSRSQGPDDAA